MAKVAKHKYKIGDTVEVFADPDNGLVSQGKAKIISLVMYLDDCYKVIFIADPEKTEVGRIIL